MSSEETRLAFNLACDIKKLKKVLIKEDDIFDKISEDDIIMVMGNLEEILRILLSKAKNEKINLEEEIN